MSTGPELQLLDVGTIRMRVATQGQGPLVVRSPGCTCSHILEGAGHWVQRERAAEVNRLLVKFLRGL